MSKTEKMVDEFVKDIHKEFADKNVIGVDYCIILYSTRGLHNQIKKVSKIYKNLDDFKKKVVADIEAIPPEFGVSCELWLYD